MQLQAKQWMWQVAVVAVCTAGALAQAPATGVPRASGTVQAVGDHSLKISEPNGTSAAITVNEDSVILQVPPNSHTLSGATPAHLADIAAGDRVLVTGVAGDSDTSLTARRIVVMKATAIAASNAAVEEAWRKGGGGLVKSVDTGAGTILVESAGHPLTVQVTPQTQLRRYAADSVSFGDTVGGTLAQVKPGDQLRVRGAKQADGSAIRADEVVTGDFANLSGVVTAVDPAAHTISLKDLATKKAVTVTVTPKTTLKRLPPQAAAMFAARAKGQARGTEGAAPGGEGPAPSGPGGTARAGSDLSQMLSRLPTETLGDLKSGDAVMIVASRPGADTVDAITVLSGVEPILRAAPAGEMTLTPWDVGGGTPSGGAQ